MLRRCGVAALTAMVLPVTAGLGVATSFGAAPRHASAAPPAVQAFGFQPVSPYRLIDTRDTASPVGPGQTIAVPVLGQGPIPGGGVDAVAINVTVTQPTEASYLTVWPSGAPMPATSTVNFLPGATIPNASVVGVGSDGTVSVFNLNGAADVVIDVTGWFPTGSGFTGLAPQRLLDTRLSPGRVPLGPDGTIDVQVADAAGVPPGGVAAVALNVTATEPTAASYLTVWPAGTAPPLASNVNVLPGQTMANSVVVGVGAGGRVSILNKFGGTHVVVDITGYVSSSQGYIPVTPARLTDTRSLGEYVNGPWTGNLTSQYPVAISGSFSHLTGYAGELAFGPAAVVLNVTVTRPSRPAFLTVWPNRAAQPRASNLNFLPGQTVANTVIVGTDRDGSFDLWLSDGTADVVIDLVGYFPADGLGLVDLNWNSRGAALGVDQIAVVFCEDTPSSHSQAMASLNNVVAPFYGWLSAGRYSMSFTDAGSTVAAGADETARQYDCFNRLSGVPLPAGTEAALGVYTYNASSAGAWGFAGTGITAADAPAFPANRRAGVISLSSLVTIPPSTSNPFWMIAAHEFGHTLDYPHSFVDTSQDLGWRQQYTNPMDLMSRESNAGSVAGAAQYTPQATLAINRFRSGWIDPSQVAVHQVSGSTYTIDAIGGSGTQMVVIPSSTRGRMTTLDTRVRQSWDGIIDKEGVEVDVSDSTCPDSSCSGIRTRIAPATGGPDSTDHVLDVGESLVLGGVTITVTGRVGNSFTVRVDGTTYDFPALSAGGLTGAATGYVCRLPGTNPG